MDSPDKRSVDFGELGTFASTTRDIVTVNELKGQCERFGSKPSQR